MMKFIRKLIERCDSALTLSYDEMMFIQLSRLS